MLPESKVIEICCIADDFCKKCVLQQEKCLGLEKVDPIRML